MARTAEEIVASIKKRLAYANPNLDLTSGNVVTDLGVESFAEELASSFSEEDRIRLLYQFEYTAFTKDEADALANAFGVYRRGATASTGTVIFGAQEAPSSGDVYRIPAGTVLLSNAENGVSTSYITTTEAIIDKDTALVPTSGYYETVAYIQAQTVGTVGNVGPGAINEMSSPINGISIVYNPNSLVNGVEEESTEDLITRLKAKVAGSTYGTKSSYLASVLSYPTIKDAVIVDPNSEFSVRGPGSIDIYILGERVGSFTQTIRKKGKTAELIKNPVIVDGNATATLYNSESEVISTYSYGADHFTIQKDDYTAYAGSAKAKDILIWNDDLLDQVYACEYYTVTYSYNSLLEDMQDELEDEDVHIVTADILVRTTHQINVQMDFDIVALNGYEPESVKLAVVYAVQNYVNNLGLDEALRQSDVINVIENTAGVDYIKLPMRVFCEKGRSVVKDVESSPLEYIRINTEDLLVG